MTLRVISTTEAFHNLKHNPDGYWPASDDPNNRFAAFASPAFQSSFALTPGQKIFTIGSCFARNVEKALVQRGFDVPAVQMRETVGIASGDPTSMLNVYGPHSIAPPIRWAFGHERFDVERHCAEVRPGLYVDLQLASVARPLPAAEILSRRERINAIYRQLADSQVVILTLGFIEGWFDKHSGLYTCVAPPKSFAAASDRFELHILDYGQVLMALEEAVDLLRKVCPSGHRLILTVSPVPLTTTWTAQDVATANTYSKAVLRAAAEAVVVRHNHIDYYPSFESVMLTERSLAFGNDQIHVTREIIRFNVDRMIRHYTRDAAAETVECVLAKASDARRSSGAQAALKVLQTRWRAYAKNPDYVTAMAETLIQTGQGGIGEKMLLALVETERAAKPHVLLARHYNRAQNFEAAARHAETAIAIDGARLAATLERITAYYHLGRLEEGLALLLKTKFLHDRRQATAFWKGRYFEKLARFAEADAAYLLCNTLVENVDYMLAYAEFLLAQGRPVEADQWLLRVLMIAPEDRTALQLRRTRSASRPRTPVPISLIARWRGMFPNAARRRSVDEP